jgi:hypothetical protein
MLELLLALALAGAPASRPVPAAVPLDLGALVRVELVERANRPSQLEGRLIELTADSLTLRSSGKVWQIPWTDVRQVQRQDMQRTWQDVQGPRQDIQRPRLALGGAALGLLAGAAVGMSAALITCHGNASSFFNDHDAAVMGGILGGAVGLAVGSAIASRPPGRWDEAPSRLTGQPPVRLMPARRGLALQVRLRF